jgi:hypothetical protein
VFFVRGTCRGDIREYGNGTSHQIRKIGMICFGKPLLTEDLCVVQKEEFSLTCYMCEMYT